MGDIVEMNQRILGLVIITVMVCLVGCSRNAKVSGKVTFPDGSPLTVGKVTFETETFTASGTLKEDGSYTIGTLSENDGLPPGVYQVYVAGAMKQGGSINMKVPTASSSGGQEMSSKAMPMYTPAVAPKFTKASTSGITCDVKKSMKFDFQVEPPN